MDNQQPSAATTDFDSFEQIWAFTQDLLLTGVEFAPDPCHTPVLGTIAPTGCALRTVVLRRFMPKQRLLICHSDSRSPKVAQLQQNPQASWLFYHPAQRIQLRITGHTTCHTNDALADEQWQNSALSSRRCYSAEVAPSQITTEPTSGLPDFLENRIPTAEESEAGRQNFLVIATRIDSLDWLFLRAKGHRRALFTWQADNRFIADWVAP